MVQVRLSKLLGALLLILAFGGNAFAGSGVGGGGGSINPTENSAWFADPARTVRYCITLSDRFGLGLEEAKKEIESVLTTWGEYQAHKRIRHGLAGKYSPMPKCDGSEDLAFYLGAETPAVTAAKLKYDMPTAFSERTSYDIWAKWGKGFVWVASQNTVLPEKTYPDWKKQGHLHVTLLHEIGHILGCEHIEGTVMTSRLARRLSGLEMFPIERGQMYQIDWSRELAVSNNPTATVTAEADIIENLPRDSAFAPFGVFYYFTGRVGAGAQKIRLSGSTQGNWYRIVFSDDIGSYEFDLTDFYGEHDNLRSEHVAFKVALPFKTKEGRTLFSHYKTDDTSSIWKTRVHSYTAGYFPYPGPWIPIVLKYNTGGAPYLLSIIDKKQGLDRVIARFETGERTKVEEPKE